MRIEDFEIRKLGKDSCSVVQYKGDDEDLVIPPVLGKYRTVAVEATLLKKGNHVRRLSIPDTVSQIDESLYPSLKSIESIDVDKHSAFFSSADGVLYDSSFYSLLFYPPKKNDETYTAPKKLGRVARSAFSCKTAIRHFAYSSKLEEFQALPSECPCLESFEAECDAPDYDGVLINRKKLLFYPPKREGRTYAIPEGVEEICTSSEPFFPPQLEKLFVPSSLRKGLENALSTLVSVDVDSASQSYRVVGTALYSWKRSLLAYPGKCPDGVYMTASGTDGIGDNAFRYSRVKTLIVSPGVVHIGNSAFEGSEITTLVIPSSVTDIAVHALYGARKLEKVIVERGSVGEIFLRGEGRDDILSVLPSLF